MGEVSPYAAISPFVETLRDTSLQMGKYAATPSAGVPPATPPSIDPIVKKNLKIRFERARFFSKSRIKVMSYLDGILCSHLAYPC